MKMGECSFALLTPCFLNSCTPLLGPLTFLMLPVTGLGCSGPFQGEGFFCVISKNYFFPKEKLYIFIKLHMFSYNTYSLFLVFCCCCCFFACLGSVKFQSISLSITCFRCVMIFDCTLPMGLSAFSSCSAQT